MPNWCQNVATIVHEDKEKIDVIENGLNKDKDDVGLFQILRPRPAEFEEDWYGWNVNNWGTKWEASVYDFDRIDDYTIKINFDTAWGPCTTLYEFLESEGYTVEGFYNEGGMAFAGCFRDGFDDYYDYSNMNSVEVQDEIPSDIDDMFSISELMQERESEEEDEDVEPEYAYEYEMTEWFDVKTKPVHVGLYDIQYDKPNAWPFPSRLTWTGKKWLNHEGEERKDVGMWRGITEKEHNMLVQMEKLKIEFDKLMVTENE
jgi:hypothetical protein